MSKKYFCTFADSRMKKSLERIEKQARDLNYFDKIFINNENDLDSDFREFFKDKLIKGSKGYGYWVWKPQIILQSLRQMDDGDVLLYTDVGCHLNKEGLERLNYYFDQAVSSPTGLFAFQDAKKPDDKNLEVSYDKLEKYYTKGDLLDYFNVRSSEDICNTGQILSGVCFVRKCKKAQMIIQSWLDVFRINSNFDLINDTVSVSNDFEGFINHRHDQSIFSVLCKINNVPTVSVAESFQKPWKKLNYYPILSKRDKDLSIYWRVRRKWQTLILSRFN